MLRFKWQTWAMLVYGILGVLLYVGYACCTFSLDELYMQPLAYISADTHRGDRDIAAMILQQRLHYIGQGNQFFVFAAEDGQHVVKLLRKRVWVPSLMRRCQRLFSQNSFLSCQTRKQKKMSALVRNCCYSFDHLREETGILAYDFQGGLGGHRLRLADRFGRERVIALDDVAWVIQKRALPLFATVVRLVAEGKEDAANALLIDAFALMCHRLEQRIFDYDVHLKDNFGVLNGRVFQFDFGSFFFSRKPGAGYRHYTAFLKKNRSFFLALRQLSAPLAECYQKEVEKMGGLCVAIDSVEECER